MNERLGTLATIEPYIGKYYSNDYVRKKGSSSDRSRD